MESCYLKSNFIRATSIENKINFYHLENLFYFITLHLLSCKIILFRNVKVFRLQEFIRHDAEQKSSFRKVPPICERPRAACRRSRWRLFTAIPPRIILSQFNQPVIKELGLTLQLYFCISTILTDSSPFFLLGRSKLNFPLPSMHKFREQKEAKR